jgi:hypothetical protein
MTAIGTITNSPSSATLGIKSHQPHLVRAALNSVMEQRASGASDRAWACISRSA